MQNDSQQPNVSNAPRDSLQDGYGAQSQQCFANDQLISNLSVAIRWLSDAKIIRSNDANMINVIAKYALPQLPHYRPTALASCYWALAPLANAPYSTNSAASASSVSGNSQSSMAAAGGCSTKAARELLRGVGMNARFRIKDCDGRSLAALLSGATNILLDAS